MFNTKIKKDLVFTNLKQTILFLRRDLCKTKSKPSQDITTVISESKLTTESWHTNLKTSSHTQSLSLKGLQLPFINKTDHKSLLLLLTVQCVVTIFILRTGEVRLGNFNAD